MTPPWGRSGNFPKAVGWISLRTVAPVMATLAVRRRPGQVPLTLGQGSFTVQVMTPVNEDRPSSNDLARRRASYRDLAPGLAVLIISELSLDAFEPDASAGGWRLAWALSPLVGIGLLVWAQLRMLQRSDERERAVELSAMAIGFGVVIAALAALGVLQASEIGDVGQQVQITTLVGIGSWVVASGVLKRRVS